MTKADQQLLDAAKSVQAWNRDGQINAAQERAAFDHLDRAVESADLVAQAESVGPIPPKIRKSLDEIVGVVLNGVEGALRHTGGPRAGQAPPAGGCLVTTDRELVELIQALAHETGSFVLVITPRPDGVDRRCASGITTLPDAVRVVAMLGTAARLAAEAYAKNPPDSEALMDAARLYVLTSETVETKRRTYPGKRGAS